MITMRREARQYSILDLTLLGDFKRISFSEKDKNTKSKNRICIILNLLLNKILITCQINLNLCISMIIIILTSPLVLLTNTQKQTNTHKS